VARFLDADPLADRPWLAMEYVAGRTLVACVDEDGVLPVPLVAGLGALLAEGLSAVHAAELLHRDLKPQNAIMGKKGPMIIDFGLGAFMDTAKESLPHSGMIIGTVRCMPPEQASGHPKVAPTADVYALGAVLLYAAARYCSYDGAAWEVVAVQVANPSIGPELSGVPEKPKPLIASMLAYVPEDRPTPAPCALAFRTPPSGIDSSVPLTGFVYDSRLWHGFCEVDCRGGSPTVARPEPCRSAVWPQTQTEVLPLRTAEGGPEPLLMDRAMPTLPPQRSQ